MLTSSSFALPCLISLLLFAEVLVFVISRREVPNDLDKQVRQRMLAVTFLRWNLVLLAMFGWAFIIVLAPQLTSALGNAFLLVWITILVVAAFINLRAIRARGMAGKPAVALSPENSLTEVVGYSAVGIFVILTSSGSIITNITGLLYFGMAAMTYLNHKRGCLLSDRGVCKNSKFIPWDRVESYNWPTNRNKDSAITINYRDKGASVKSLTIVAPEWNRAHIEAFLDKKVANMLGQP